MRLVLLTFGNNLKNHYQATFSSLTFLLDPSIKALSIITDAPEYYALLNEDSRVTLEIIEQKILQNWRGEDNFFWRIKIKALEMMINQYLDEDILYVDSDTFLYQSLADVEKQFSQSIPVMHLRENLLSECPTKTQKQMWKKLAHQQFSGFEITPDTAMFNAGAIGIPKQNAKQLIADALKLCDALTKTKSKTILLEQLAFSIALNKASNLATCENTIGHYWGSKEIWNQAIKDFLVEGLIKGKSLEALISQTKDFDYYSLPIRGGNLKKNARRLHTLVDKIFKNKTEYFLQKIPD